MGHWLLVVLSLFTGLMVVMGIVTLAANGTYGGIMTWNKGQIPALTGMVGLAALALSLFARRGLATAVAIFTDVLVYLNDYSWRSREMAERVPDADRNRSAASAARRRRACRAIGCAGAFTAGCRS